MQLQFLTNPTQRLATNKKLPTREVECVLLYGSAPQRTRATKKIIEHATALSSNKLTQHLVTSMCTVSDNVVRAELLFNIRRSLAELSRSRVGNVVVQHLFSLLPEAQRRDMADQLKDDVCDLARHPFGNHVVQKMLEAAVCADMWEAELAPVFATLAPHPVGQHVAAKLVAARPDTFEPLLVADDFALLRALVDGTNENAVVTVVARGERTEEAAAFTRAALLDGLQAASTAADAAEAPAAPAAAPAAGKGGRHHGRPQQQQTQQLRHHFALTALASTATEAELVRIRAILGANAAFLRRLIMSSGWCAFVAALAGKEAEGKPVVTAAAIGKAVGKRLDHAAKDAYASMVLRAFAERDALEPSVVAEWLVPHAGELAFDSRSAPLLLRLIQAGNVDVQNAVAAVVGGDVARACRDTAASHLVQGLLVHGAEPVRARLLKDATFTGPETLRDLAMHRVASFALQRLLQVCDDEQFAAIAEDLVAAPTAPRRRPQAEGEEAAEEGENEADAEVQDAAKRPRAPLSGLLMLSKDPAACHAVAVLLREAKRRNLVTLTRTLMNELKPHVHQLVLAALTGRVVFEVMCTVGSAELKKAMREVIYMKCEAYLSGAPVGNFDRSATALPTNLRRQREETEGGDGNPTAAKKKSKKLVPSYKK